MEDLLAARMTMATSMAFHIIFAAIGMTMPFLMSAAHYLYIKTEKAEYLELTKMWMKGVAILFAVGAASGTILSFELGLLWPGFMEHAGPIIGMPFSLEGTAFFLEAVAIGLFLYGWDRMNPWVHWLSGLMVGFSGFISGVFVVAANGWMNSPTGFDWVDGKAINIDPIAAMFNPSWLHESIHMQVAALQAVGFAVAGIHAFQYLRGNSTNLNKAALKIALVIGASASIIQPLIGHYAAQRVAELQPAKLAAMEGHFKTEKFASLYIGGYPNVEKEQMEWGIPIPGALSFMAFNSFDAEVKGLDQFPKDEWPPVAITHIAFQIMVGIGTLMAGVGVLYFFLLYKKQLPKIFLKLLVVMTPFGFIAIEAGWVVTEVGRQPWIIYGIMKTKDALSPIPGMAYHFALFTSLYVFLGSMTIWLLKRHIDVAQNNAEKT